MRNPNIDQVNFKGRGKEERSCIAKMGGSVTTPQKTLAARIRGIKWAKTSVTKYEAVEKTIDLLVDPRLSEFEILRFAEEIKRSNLTTSQKIRLLEAVTKVHTAVHGSKSMQQVQEVNLQMDTADLMLDEVFGRRKKEEEKNE